MISVAGGKLTTYRLIARAVVAELAADVGLARVDGRPFPLPGAGEPGAIATGLRRSFPELEPEPALQLARTYGSLAEEVLAHYADRADALEPVVPGAPEVVAQVLYARYCESALDAEDVVRRRTTLALRRLDSPALRAWLDLPVDEQVRAGRAARADPA